jgi:hypothetical protein
MEFMQPGDAFMIQWHRLSAMFSIGIVLLAAHGISEAKGQLKAGDLVPSLGGESLAGGRVDLPQDAHGSQAVLIFSFSRAGGRDTREWTQHIEKDNPQLKIYTIIVLESVPRFMRNRVAAGIKREIPAAMQARTMFLYRDERLWKQRLRMEDDRHGCITLIGPDDRNGPDEKIQWMASEAFTDASYGEMKNHLQVLK